MHYDRSQRIRRAAILVASLDEALAEQMLQNLPRLEATRILDEVDRLGELDAEEVQDVLDEFRSAGRYGRGGVSATEFTYSAPAPAAAATPPTTATSASEPSPQEEAEAKLMAELLSHEHPQTIAAALSRLEQGRSATVFAELPGDLQAEVLHRLANLDSVDETAVVELESQLSQRMAQQRQRRERAEASAELARRILEKTPTAQRDGLLASLSRTAPAGQAVRESLNPGPAWSQPQHPSPASEKSFAARRYEAVVEDEAAVAPPPESVVLPDGSRELESLRDRDLLAALRLADERTVHRALAASSEKFVRRVAGKLSRQEASRLRQVVRSIGPTRLADLREAQHTLLRLARGGQPSPASPR